MPTDLRVEIDRHIQPGQTRNGLIVEAIRAHLEKQMQTQQDQVKV